MSKGFALVLVLVFLTASCIMVAKPVSGASAIGNSWVEKAPMPTARADLGVAAVNGKIYAIGGQILVFQNGHYETKDLGITEEYDPATNNWTSKASMPVPSSSFATAVYQNKIYCIGRSINEVYTPATDTWENKTPPPAGGSFRQANVVNGKIYAIGGDPNDTKVYDPTTDTWILKAPMPKTGGATPGVFDNKIYLIGGYDDGGYYDSAGNYIPPNPQSITRIYDPATDTWSTAAPPPNLFFTGSSGFTTGLMAPKCIYVFCNPYNAPNSTFYLNQVYDPEKDSWVAGAGIPSGRQDFGVAVVNDLIYVIGGFMVTYHSILSFDQSPAYIYYGTNEEYIPFGYGTIPPAVSLVSPENVTYHGNLSLAFTLSEPASWLGYSLDGIDNVTIAGNTTISGLPNGLHNITVYANDTFGNIGASETINFTIAKPEPFPTATVATVAGTSAAVVVGACLLVYFKKGKPATHDIIGGEIA